MILDNQNNLTEHLPQDSLCSQRPSQSTPLIHFRVITTALSETCKYFHFMHCL